MTTVELIEQQLQALERGVAVSSPRWPWLLIVLGVVVVVGLGVHGYTAFATIDGINGRSKLDTPNPVVLFQDLATNGPRVPATVEASSRNTYGRAQGIQHVLRGIALGLALVGSQFLLKVWEPAPFVTAAFITTGACGAAILFVREDGGHGRVFEGVVAYFKRSWRIVREEAEVRQFLIANAAWEGTFAAARAFMELQPIALRLDATPRSSIWRKGICDEEGNPGKFDDRLLRGGYP